MSAVLIRFNDSEVIIGTDTQCSELNEKGELNVLNYTCKVFSLPQFKSCFATTGRMDLGILYFEFVITRCMGKDIDSLTNIDLSHFRNFLESREKLEIDGTIYLFGLSEADSKFKGYRYRINDDDSWFKYDSNNLIMQPRVSDYQFKLEAVERPKENPLDFLKELMIIQKLEDDSLEPEQRVGIGGEVIITILSMAEGTKYLNQAINYYVFDDYLERGQKMMNRNYSH